jgi:glycosyltransferase involved in cell wall biosynthesis
MDPPLFSVVIPTFNRAAGLKRVLEAYEIQDPQDLAFEVIVVDDGSTDDTREVLAGWRCRRFRLRVARQTNSGPARARNRALGLSRGEIILFTGDDIVPSSRLLWEHYLGHCDRPREGVAILGRTEWPAELALSATMRHIDGPGAQQFSYYYLNDGEEYDFRHFYTSNVSARRALLTKEAAGFRSDFPAAAFEDAEYAWRLSRLGLAIRYRATAVAYHHHPYGVRSFFQRQHRCGKMATVLFNIHPQLKRWARIDDIETERVSLVVLSQQREEKLTEVADELQRWENRALSVAELYDLSDSDGVVDAILLPLFEYGFLKGVAETYLANEAVSRRVCASLFLKKLPLGVGHFCGRARDRAWALPERDVTALMGLLGGW